MTITIPDGITVTMNVQDSDTENQQDAAFYVSGAGENTLVATVTNGNATAYVRCVGMMHVDVWETVESKNNGEPADRDIRDYSDLIYEGLTTDALLDAADDRLEWENNAWFEVQVDADSDGNACGVLYDLGEVSHLLDEALGIAIITLTAKPE
jgi:hypothetical protein